MNKKILKGPIESKALALHVIKSAAMFFYAIAGLEVLVAIIASALDVAEYSVGGAIFGAAILALLAYWLQKSNSKVAAVILLILSILGIIGGIATIAAGGIINLAFAVIAAWLSARAMNAAGYLAKHKTGGEA